MIAFFKILSVLCLVLSGGVHAGLRDDKAELTLYEPDEGRIYSLPALPLKPQPEETPLRFAQRSVGHMLMLDKWKSVTLMPLGRGPIGPTAEESSPASDSEGARSLNLSAQEDDVQETALFSAWTRLGEARRRYTIFTYLLWGDPITSNKKPKAPRLEHFGEESKAGVMSRQWIEDILVPLEETPENPWKTTLKQGDEFSRIVIVASLKKGSELVPSQECRLQCRYYGVKDGTRFFSSRNECSYLKPERFMSPVDLKPNKLDPSPPQESQEKRVLGIIGGTFGVPDDFYPKDLLEYNAHLKRADKAYFESGRRTAEVLAAMRKNQAIRRALKASQGSGSGSSSEASRPAPVVEIPVPDQEPQP